MAAFASNFYVGYHDSNEVGPWRKFWFAISMTN